MPGPSPFTDDWRDCLRAHYQFVIRSEDLVAVRTLPLVLADLGFSTAELHELAIRATLHVDEMPPDFVPDIAAVEQALRAAGSDPAQAASLIAEAAAEAAVSVEYDQEGLDALFEDEPPPPDASSGKQMSLF